MLYTYLTPLPILNSADITWRFEAAIFDAEVLRIDRCAARDARTYFGGRARTYVDYHARVILDLYMCTRA